jgi:FAD binding domain
MLCSLLADACGLSEDDAGLCSGSKVFGLFGFGFRFGEGERATSVCSSHLDRLRDGVEDIKSAFKLDRSLYRDSSLMFSLAARRRLARWPSTTAPRRWAHPPPLKFNSVNEQDLAHFAKFLPPTSILSTLSPSNLPAEELASYNNDWMQKYCGRATTVLKPKTTDQVSKIVRHCNERRIAIVPQGGNTGLVGGSVPINDEVVLNLSNMSNVRSFDPVSGLSVCLLFCSFTLKL